MGLNGTWLRLMELNDNLHNTNGDSMGFKGDEWWYDWDDIMVI